MTNADSELDSGAGQHESTESVLAHFDDLPSLPSLVRRLLKLPSDPKPESKLIAQCLQDSPADARVVAGLVPHAAEASDPPFETLVRAIDELGFALVRRIVVSRAAFLTLSPNGGDAVAQDLRTHSLEVAAIAAALARAGAGTIVNPIDALLAGLLHDIGQLALYRVYPRTYARIVVNVERYHGAIADAERNVLGVDHTVAGRYVADHWGLPEPYRNVIWFHHLSAETLPTGMDSRALISIVQLAEFVARDAHIGFSDEFAADDLSEILRDQLGFTPAQLDRIANCIEADTAACVKLLQLDLPQAAPPAPILRDEERTTHHRKALVAENERLAAVARCYDAIVGFERSLEATATIRDVLCAASRVLNQYCDLGANVAFAWSHGDLEVEFCTTEPGDDVLRRGLRVAAPPVLQSLGRDAFDVLPAPEELVAFAADIAPLPGEGPCWIMPFRDEMQFMGGVLFRDATSVVDVLRRSPEACRGFTDAVARAIARTRAHAAARRLSDDLAEANRRLQQAQRQTLRTRTLSMIAEMAAGAAHELNTPLTVISGRAQMMREQVLDAEQRKTLELIVQKSHDCSRIVTELMDFARPAHPQLAAVNLVEVLDEARARTDVDARDAAELISIAAPRTAHGVHPTTPLARADRQQLYVVFEELYRNALDAIDKTTGRIRVSWSIASRNVEDSGLPMYDRELGAPAEWVDVTVQDNGHGMPPDVLKRAFDPFFSYRKAGRRRGLGLPRAHRIIEAHGGRIWLESRAGQGVTAHVVLPHIPRRTGRA